MTEPTQGVGSEGQMSVLPSTIIGGVGLVLFAFGFAQAPVWAEMLVSGYILNKLANHLSDSWQQNPTLRHKEERNVKS